MCYSSNSRKLVLLLQRLKYWCRISSKKHHHQLFFSLSVCHLVTLQPLWLPLSFYFALSFGSCCAHKMQSHREASMWTGYYTTGFAAYIKISCFPCNGMQGGQNEHQRRRKEAVDGRQRKPCLVLSSREKKKKSYLLKWSIVHCKWCVFEEWEILHRATTDSIWADNDWDIIFFWHPCDWWWLKLIQMMESLNAFISKLWGEKEGDGRICMTITILLFPYGWMTCGSHYPRKQAHIHVLCVS